MENWKAIPGFGTYEVSDLGFVKRIGSASPLRPYMRGGYPAVTLSRSRKDRAIKAVHLAVLEAFVSARPARHYGAHLDGNARNSALANLRWVTQVENERHKRAHGTAPLGERSVHARLTDEQAEIIREIATAGITQTKLAILTGISENSISDIVRRRRYSATEA